MENLLRANFAAVRFDGQNTLVNDVTQARDTVNGTNVCESTVRVP